MGFRHPGRQVGDGEQAGFEDFPRVEFQAVEPAYEGAGPAYSCVNPKFFDCTDDIRAFDLRDAFA